LTLGNNGGGGGAPSCLGPARGNAAMNPPAHRVRRVLVFLISVILIGGVVAVLVSVWPGSAPPAPEEPPPPAPVKWEPARIMSVGEWTEVIGTTQPLSDRAARITAPLEGRVISVLQGPDGKPVLEGQHVKKGDVIVQLNSAL